MFNSIDNTKKYQQVINQIENLILSQELKTGDKLPSENELMELLGVSRNSVREAISALSAMGLVTRKAKEGTIISYNYELGVCRPMSLTYKLDGGTIADVVSFRFLLDVQIVKMVILKCTDEDFVILDKTQESLFKSTNIEELLECDHFFHFQLATISGNKLMCYFNRAIGYLAHEQMNFTYTALQEREQCSFEGTKQIIYQNHSDIIAAIKHRDMARATHHLAEGFELAQPKFDFSYERQCL